CFFFQAEDGIRDFHVTGVQTCALPIFGFPIENKRELEEAARAEGVDFVLLFTEEERWRFAEGMSGAELINEIMRIGAELRSYDAVILLGSDMRIGLMESLIGKENVIGIEIGRSPIRRDVRVEVDRIVELLRALKV